MAESKSEAEYVNNIGGKLKRVFTGKYVVEISANLFYQITIDNNLDVTVDPKNPTRGHSAFQTDLCIFLRKGGIFIPKVVMEFKKGITTHDVITYNNKAQRHKSIYPYLRYGIISYELVQIPKRFLFMGNLWIFI
jgi:hypothetical protein